MQHTFFELSTLVVEEDIGSILHLLSQGLQLIFMVTLVQRSEVRLCLHGLLCDKLLVSSFDRSYEGPLLDQLLSRLLVLESSLFQIPST